MSILRKNPAARALEKLSELLVEAGVVLELALCHGRVISLAYCSREASPENVCTNDIAARLCEIVREEQREVPGWLQNDVPAYINGAMNHHLTQPAGPGLILSSNGSARVLALKLHLLRREGREEEEMPADSTDAEDAEFLLERISVSTPKQISYIYERAFPGCVLSEKAQEMVDHAFHARTAMR